MNLKLCPFCDSDRLENLVAAYDGGRVMCIDCGACGPNIGRLEKRLRRLLTGQYKGSGFVAWNHRGIVAATMGLVLLVLSGCGGAVAEDPVERFARAVCACGSGHDGCLDNVRSEARGANLDCLNEWAETYETSCSGLPAPDCELQ